MTACGCNPPEVREGTNSPTGANGGDPTHVQRRVAHPPDRSCSGEFTYQATRHFLTLDRSSQKPRNLQRSCVGCRNDRPDSD